VCSVVNTVLGKVQSWKKTAGNGPVSSQGPIFALFSGRILVLMELVLKPTLGDLSVYSQLYAHLGLVC